MTDPIRNLTVGLGTSTSGDGSITSIGINDDGTRLVTGYYGSYYPRMFTFNGTTWSAAANMFTATVVFNE